LQPSNYCVYELLLQQSTEKALAAQPTNCSFCEKNAIPFSSEALRWTGEISQDSTFFSQVLSLSTKRALNFCNEIIFSGANNKQSSYKLLIISK